MPPAENRILNWLSMGEGQHNYHHTFAYDYRNGELTWWQIFNPASLFIKICQWLGLAWDLKKPSRQLVQSVVESRGDLEYFQSVHHQSTAMKVVVGILDWTMGCLMIQWPMYVVIGYKTAVGAPMFVF